MAQQTAVEWLVDELLDGKVLMPSLIEQAKQMEKEQIMKAFLDGKVNYRKDWAYQYYNKTFGKS